MFKVPEKDRVTKHPNLLTTIRLYYTFGGQ